MTYTGLIVVTSAILLMWLIMHRIEKKPSGKRSARPYRRAPSIRRRIGPVSIASNLLAKALYRFLTSRPATIYIERLVHRQFTKTGIVEQVSGLEDGVRELHQRQRAVLVTVGCLLGLLTQSDTEEQQDALVSLFKDWTEMFNLRIETDRRIEELLVKLPNYEDIPKTLQAEDFVSV